MAITYPRELPSSTWVRGSLELRRFLAQNALAGGGTDVLDLAEPRWGGSFESAPLERADAQQFSAWFNSLRGGLKDFLAYDAYRPYPLAYKDGFTGLTRAGGGSFDGTATVTARTGQTISLSTLPANFALTAGDMVGLTQTISGTVQYGLHEIVETVTANGSGAVTVSVEPAVLTSVFTTSAVANFAKPKCRMVIDPASRDFTPTAEPTPFLFSGIQRLI